MPWRALSFAVVSAALASGCSSSNSTNPDGGTTTSATGSTSGKSSTTSASNSSTSTSGKSSGSTATSTTSTTTSSASSTGSTTGTSASSGTTSSSSSSSGTASTTSTSGAACDLSIVPSPIGFASVPAGQTANATVTVTNLGSTSAALGCFYLDSLGATACGQSSAAFALSGLPQLPDTLPAEGTVTFTVSYTASGDASGDTDQLDVSCIAQGSSNSSVATDPLLGNVSLTPCSLTITPSTINFGTVALGTPVVATTTLGNVGQTTCNLTVSLDGASDPSFTLDPSQAANFSIPAGGTAQVTADFNLDSSQPPNTRTGAIDYQSNDPNHATGQIPMTATL